MPDEKSNLETSSSGSDRLTPTGIVTFDVIVGKLNFSDRQPTTIEQDQLTCRLRQIGDGRMEVDDTFDLRPFDRDRFFVQFEIAGVGVDVALHALQVIERAALAHDQQVAIGLGLGDFGPLFGQFFVGICRGGETDPANRACRHFQLRSAG